MQRELFKQVKQADLPDGLPEIYAFLFSHICQVKINPGIYAKADPGEVPGARYPCNVKLFIIIRFVSVYVWLCSFRNQHETELRTCKKVEA